MSAVGKKRLTWAQRIAAARKRGRFLKAEIELANDWGTCAVGEASGATKIQAKGTWDRYNIAMRFLDRDYNNLYEAGDAFYTAVKYGDIEAAAENLAIIKAAR